MEFDYKELMKDKYEKSIEVINQISLKYDALDILNKLILLVQLNSHKEIIGGLTFASVENFIILSKQLFNDETVERITKEDMMILVESLVSYSWSGDDSDKLALEYSSFVSFAQNVKGDAFPHQIFQQNYEILMMIEQSFEHHLDQSVISFFKFISTLRNILIEKYVSLVTPEIIETLECANDMVELLFTKVFDKDRYVSVDEIITYRLQEEDELNKSEVMFYLDLFSRDINNPVYNDYIGVERYPILNVNDKLLSIHHNYFTWNQKNKVVELVQRNDKLYEKYNKSKAKWLETKTYEYVNKVFDEKFLVKNPNYYLDGELVESDLLIDYHGTLIIIECKSHHIKTVSKIGNFLKFKKDVKNILEDSYIQADRLRKHIAKTLLSDDFKVFNSNGKSVVKTIKKGSPDRIIMINVTLDNLKALATMLDRFHNEGVYRKGTDIVSFNIHDLEYIVDFLDKPFKFIDYTIKRIERVKKYHVVDELDYLGWYQDTLLNMVVEMDYASFYMAEDYIPYFEKYSQGLEEKMELKVNRKWLALIEMMSLLEYPRKLPLELGLLNMKEEGLLELLDAIENFSNDEEILKGLKAKTFTFFPEDETSPNMVITFIYVSEDNYEQGLFDRVRSKVKTRFRNSKKKHWYCIVLCGSDVKVKGVIYESSNVFVKIGRNKPCPCGSGFKYKRCCLK